MASKHKQAITIGSDPITGKAIRKYFYGSTKKEVRQKIDEWKIQKATHDYSIHEMPFSSWAYRWLSLYKEGSVSDATYRMYRLAVDKLSDHFKDIPISEVTPEMIQSYFKSVKGLSQSSVDKLYITSKNIFETAFNNNYCSKNPMASIRKTKGVKPQEKRVFTPEQFHIVKEFSRSDPDGIGVFLILSTGVRRGELMGIIPSKDFDLKNGTFKCQRTITDTYGKAELKKTLKNGDKSRMIPLDPSDIDYLRSDIRFRMKDYLFTVNGHPMAPGHWSKFHLKRFYSRLEAIHPDIPHLNPHELRHSYATMLFKAGNDPYTVQKILGHKTLEVTMQIYVHDDFDDVKSRVLFPEPQGTTKEPQFISDNSN